MQIKTPVRAKPVSLSSSIGSAPPVDAARNPSDDSPGSTDSSSRPPATPGPTLLPTCSTFAVPDARCTSVETTSSVRLWLVANGLPLERLETRAQARGISVDLQLAQMIQYCLENGVNGD